MDITQDMLAKFAGKLLARGEHLVRIQLAVGEHATGDNMVYEGPCVLELTVFRDGGWSVREQDAWSTTAIALWLSL